MSSDEELQRRTLTAVSHARRDLLREGFGRTGKSDLPVFKSRLLPSREDERRSSEEQAKRTADPASQGRVVIFLHLERTGGSNFWATMCNSYDRTLVNVVDLYQEARHTFYDKTELEVLSIRLTDIRSVPTPVVIHLHSPEPVWKLLNPTDYTLCIIREPVTRFVSHLNHLLNYVCHVDVANAKVLYTNSLFRYKRAVGERIATAGVKNRDDRFLLLVSDLFGERSEFSFEAIRQRAGDLLGAIPHRMPELLRYYECWLTEYFGDATTGLKPRSMASIGVLAKLARVHFDYIGNSTEAAGLAVSTALQLPPPVASDFRNSAPQILRKTDFPLDSLRSMLGSEIRLYSAITKMDQA